MGGTGPVLDQTEVWIWVSPVGWRYCAEATDWSQVGPQVWGEAALTAWEVLPPETRVRGPPIPVLWLVVASLLGVKQALVSEGR